MLGDPGWINAVTLAACGHALGMTKFKVNHWGFWGWFFFNICKQLICPIFCQSWEYGCGAFLPLALRLSVWCRDVIGRLNAAGSSYVQISARGSAAGGGGGSSNAGIPPAALCVCPHIVLMPWSSHRLCYTTGLEWVLCCIFWDAPNLLHCLISVIYWTQNGIERSGYASWWHAWAQQGNRVDVC